MQASVSTVEQPSFLQTTYKFDVRRHWDADDKTTSHPIEWVPSRFGAAADREIVDVDTLEQNGINGNTAFVVRGLIIVKVRTDISFYYIGCAYCKKRMIVDDHGNHRFERHACLGGKTYFLGRAELKPTTKRRLVHVLHPLF
ncbi:hypothetical protein NP493_1564g00005 [Ridgeia piscesae]|uniref:Uncharacterized protein n=1 Tax=Ridgeia piscesae TaxID=27915 RepID=A0AAD9K0M6_RIDPI|nr:hypothetical protein NP493_1564g00005 [Ridgeia piscesae]